MTALLGGEQGRRRAGAKSRPAFLPKKLAITPLHFSLDFSRQL